MSDPQADRIKQLEQRVDELAQHTFHRNPFDVARDVFSSLQLYRRHYSSGQQYQAHHREIVGILRHLGQNSQWQGDRPFYSGLADLLERWNTPGSQKRAGGTAPGPDMGGFPPSSGGTDMGGFGSS